LVVDDEPDLVELVSFNLRAEGYDVVTAANGLEALDRARAVLPDLIVLDLMMPELDGLSVCEILRRLPSTAPIPVIMLTAWKSELTRIIGMDTGARLGENT
jgi:DNA-binding response OmpR family regulator